MIWVVDIKPYQKNISFHKDIGETFNKHIKHTFWNTRINPIGELEKEGKLKEAEDLGDDDKEIDYFRSLEKKFFPDYLQKSLRANTSKKLLEIIEKEKQKVNPTAEGYVLSEEYRNRLKEWSIAHLNHDYILMVWKYKHQRWNQAELPLFFDIGDEYIYRSIENIKYGNGFIVKKYSKKYFVNHYNN